MASGRSAATVIQVPSVLPDLELFARMRVDGDQHARELLVERYLPLARRLARRYQHTDEPIEDLIQVASIGLLKAIDRFDCSREVTFSSYAVPTILGELKRHFRDRTWSVRVPARPAGVGVASRSDGHATVARSASLPVGRRGRSSGRSLRGAGARGARGDGRLQGGLARCATPRPADEETETVCRRPRLR